MYKKSEKQSGIGEGYRIYFQKKSRYVYFVLTCCFLMFPFVVFLSEEYAYKMFGWSKFYKSPPEFGGSANLIFYILMYAVLIFLSFIKLRMSKQEKSKKNIEMELTRSYFFFLPKENGPMKVKWENVLDICQDDDFKKNKCVKVCIKDQCKTFNIDVGRLDGVPNVVADEIISYWRQIRRA